MVFRWFINEYLDITPMVSKISHKKQSIFLCDICGLGYKKQETAEECEEYCKTYHSCSIEITSKAIFYPKNAGIKESK
jgi:hypothetical protein